MEVNIMKRARKFKDILKHELKDQVYKQAFEEEGLYASIAIQIAKLREKYGYSQKDLAKLLDTKQQVISRLEDPDNHQYSLSTLVKLAQAFHKKLQIKFV